MKRLSIIFLTFLLLVASCSREDDFRGEGASLDLRFSVVPMQGVTIDTKGIKDEDWEDGRAYKAAENERDFNLGQLILYFFRSGEDDAVCGLRLVLNSGDFTYGSDHVAIINKVKNVPLAKLAKCINASGESYVFAIANCYTPNDVGGVFSKDYVLAGDSATATGMNEGVTLGVLKNSWTPVAHFDWGGTQAPDKMLMTGSSTLEWDAGSKTLKNKGTEKIPLVRLACKIRLFVTVPNELWDRNNYRWERNTDQNPRDSLRYHQHSTTFGGSLDASKDRYVNWVQYLDHQIDVDGLHYFTAEYPFYIYPFSWDDGHTYAGCSQHVMIVTEWRKAATEYWGFTDDLDSEDQNWDTKVSFDDTIDDPNESVLVWKWRYHKLAMDLDGKTLTRNTYYRYVVHLEDLGANRPQDAPLVNIEI